MIKLNPTHPTWKSSSPPLTNKKTINPLNILKLHKMRIIHNNNGQRKLFNKTQKFNKIILNLISNSNLLETIDNNNNNKGIFNPHIKMRINNKSTQGWERAEFFPKNKCSASSHLNCINSIKMIWINSICSSSSSSSNSILCNTSNSIKTTLIKPSEVRMKESFIKMNRSNSKMIVKTHW